MENYGPDKEIYITLDEDYTHAIILNTAMPKIKENIPKKNIIGFSQEPLHFLGLTQEFVDYSEKFVGKYYIGSSSNLLSPFIVNQCYMWYNYPLKHIPEKKRLMSIMVSDKFLSPGHKYRHALVKEILKTNLPIDIYGRGCIYYNKINDSRIKGSYNESGDFYESYEPYESYMFHICIENFQTEHYFSEKIINSLLCKATPIYLGCHNISHYFPNMIHVLNGNVVSNDMSLLANIIANPKNAAKDINVDIVKQKVNLLGNLSSIFE
jgi:hypothetical protein